jgi:tetratricopeptide (TPR) repeat protein
LTKVLSLAPNHPMAHYLLGLVQIFSNRAAQGITYSERALALDRDLSVAHGLIGGAKYFSGCGGETEAHTQEALRLSPRDTSAYLWLVWVGNAKSQLGADDEAVAWYRRGIEVNRNFAGGHFFLTSGLAPLGRLDEARAAAQAGLALDPAFTISRYRAGPSTDNPDLSRRARADVRRHAQGGSAGRLNLERSAIRCPPWVERRHTPCVNRTSALPLKADIRRRHLDVR